MARTERVSVPLPEPMMAKLDELKVIVGKKVGIWGLSANITASWALQYVLSLDATAAMRAILDGKACEEGKTPEPEPVDETPSSLPVNKTSTTILVNEIKKPRKGGVKGLDGNRPAGRKVSDSPRRK